MAQVAPEKAAEPELRRRHSSGTEPRPNVELSLINLDHFVKVKAGCCRSGSKQVLFNVSARFQSGQLVALMGPSGAGKSSLLGCIAAGRNPGLRLNGQALPSQYRSLCCTIPQADIMYPALSAKQALTYSALLRLPSSLSRAAIDERVEEVIDDLQLQKCKNTPVGSETIRGVSGGERKRASIGTELVSNPSILFVDEPTSGLDSKTAEDVVQLLRELARRGRLIVCTIHQPSWGIFEKFDKLLLLHHGKVVYHGAGGNTMRDYFARPALGMVPAEFENPLDCYMRILQDETDAEKFPRIWAELEDKDRDAIDVVTDKDYSQPLTAQQIRRMRAANGGFHQFQVLMRRAAFDNVKDKEKFVQNLGMKLGVGVLMGIIFINQGRKDTYASIMPTTSPLFFLVLQGGIDTLFASVMEYPLTRSLIVREFKNGAFAFAPYFFAQVLTNLFFDILSSMFYLPAYFLIGLGSTPGQILIFLAGLGFVTVIGSALGIMFGSFAKDIKEAQGYVMPILMPLLLFSGFLLPKTEIPEYFLVFYYLSPFQYCLSALLINEFAEREFEGMPPGAACALPAGPNATDLPKFTGLMYLKSQDIDPNSFPHSIPDSFGILGIESAVLLVLAFIVVRYQIIKQAQQT